MKWKSKANHLLIDHLNSVLHQNLCSFLRDSNVNQNIYILSQELNYNFIQLNIWKNYI